MRCENCKEKCTQAEAGSEIAKERMYATNEVIDCVKKIEKMKDLLEKAVEEIENIYNRETEFTEEIRDLLDNLNQQVPSNLSIR